MFRSDVGGIIHFIPSLLAL